MDVYISNMFSSAGNRITYQPQFQAGVAASTVSQLQRMARGNTLYLNFGEPRAGTARFDDVSEAMQVTMGRWAWASKFIDLTNDGWQDLLVANGYLTNELPDDL